MEQKERTVVVTSLESKRVAVDLMVVNRIVTETVWHYSTPKLANFNGLAVPLFSSVEDDSQDMTMRHTRDECC